MIEYVREQELFHLHNAFLSCVLALRRDEEGARELVMPYLGSPLTDPACCLSRLDLKEGASFDSLRQKLPYACPTAGRGNYRPALAEATDASGQRCTELFFEGYRTEKGKPRLEGLPATYTEDPDEADTLILSLRDLVTSFSAELYYTLYRDRPVMTVSARYGNGGAETLTLRRAGSLCVSLPGRWDMLHLPGAWSRERNAERIPPARMTRSISSCRGASGHEHNPFAALLRPDTTEFNGECLGVSLVYSGDFEIAADENAFGTTQLTAGINPASFSWRLRPGETFRAPEAVCVWSDAGLNAMSQAFHALFRQRLCRGKWRDRERPVLINNWEATYFDFNEEKLLKIARRAAQAGIELFVLDDGWFGKRNTDHCSLGDWTVNREKLPGGLKHLADELKALGMMFGLWFEPEMVSPDSDLYRAHPDWCLHAEGRRRTQSRNQLILDMSRTEVQDYVIGAVSEVLESAEISYVKWDMNRNFKEAGSAELLDGREAETGHRYMLGLYRVLETVVGRFPDVLFESCSGGGGRFDPGMLYYMPQTWTSDNTDAMARLKIQYGTSYVYPASAMGAHVSAVPNHQTNRITPIDTRAAAAMGGNFGYELDLTALSEQDFEAVCRQTQMVKRLRATTLKGVFTRLLPPEENVTAWQFADEKRIILCVFRHEAVSNTAPVDIRLKNLPEGVWTDGDGKRFHSADLMNAGIRVSFPKGDFVSQTIIFEK